MKLLLTICCLFATLIVSAQPTQAEIDAMMKKIEKIQKQADSIRNDPRIKKAIENKDKPFPTGGGSAPSSGGASGGSGGFDKKNLPAKDSARIKIIPKKDLSVAELNAYLVTLRSQLKAKLPPAAVSSAEAIAAKLNHVPSKLESAALFAWQKGATEESVLLITDAAVRTGEDGLILTNAGGILDMSGLSEYAIPILRTVVKDNPQNTIALNNLGQAYTQLGLTDSATRFLQRCVSNSPYHPEANNTLGIIEYKKGNKPNAKKYFENAIRGGFSLTAYHGLRSADKEAKIAKLIRPKVKLPEYFNMWKYQLPKQCENLDEAMELKKQHEDMMVLILRMKSKFTAMRKAAAQEYPKSFQKLQEKVMKQEGNIMKPFQALGAAMYWEIHLDYTKDIFEADQFNKKNRALYKALEKEYSVEFEKLIKPYADRAQSDCCGEGDISCCPEEEEVCRAVNGLKNKYLPKFAEINTEWQTYNLAIYKKYFDELLFWNYLSATTDIEFKVRFYNMCETYFIMLQNICQTKILEPCDNEPAEPEKPEEHELKEYDCPIDIEIPLIVGKIELNCESFSFKAGQGIQFKYEKKFTGQRQSTMSLGIGAEIYKLKAKIAGAEAGIEASAGMSIFFTFDNMSHLVDGGIQYGASASAGVEFEVGERVKMKKDMKIEAAVGWRVGVSSGINFNQGPLKGLLK